MKMLKRQRTDDNSSLIVILTGAVLALLTACVYYPSLHYDFRFDDLASITRHFNIRHYNFTTLFFTGTRWISYWINSLHYKIGRFDPFCYRCTNLFIHIVNGLLVYGMILLCTRQCGPTSWYRRYNYLLATLTAALFLLHPVSTQTVSYVIQGQLEGLATMSMLTIIILSFYYAHARSWPYLFLYGAAMLIVAFLSSGTKEIAIIIPGMVMLTDWFFIAQGSLVNFKRRIPLYTAITTVIIGCYLYLLKPTFFKVILGLSYEVKNNLGNVITHEPAAIITPYIYAISQFKVILHYLWIFICPYGISVEYDWRLVRHFFDFDCFVPFLILCFCVGTLIYLLYRDKKDPLVFGGLWFLCAIAPRSTIVPSPELIVDYKTYPASIGWLFIISCSLVLLYSWAYSWYEQNWYRGLCHAGIACACLLLCYNTVLRNRVWSSGFEFWGNVIANAPTKARAYNNYGVELSHVNKFAEAIPYFLKAIALDRNYQDPCNNLGVAYAQTGNIDKAIETMAASLRINPYYPEGYNNLASFLIAKREFARARLALENALRLRPYYGKALFNMGRVNLEEGKAPEAFEYFKKCCMRGDLDTAIGFDMFGRVSMMLHKYEDAIVAYKNVIALDPSYPEVFFSLANAYALSNKMDEAIPFYRQFLARSDDVRAWFNLGEALITRNEYQEALDAYQRAVGAASQFPQVYSRMALCYEKLGDPHRAYHSLAQVVAYDIPAAQKDAIASLLQQLKERYNLVV